MKKILILLFILFLSFAFIPANHVNAGTSNNTLTDPLNISDKENAPQILIGRIINAVLGVVGSIALLMFIYGGFIWMTAAGASENVTKGKNILLWASIGLIIIFSSYALVKFVIDGLTTTTTTTTTTTN